MTKARIGQRLFAVAVGVMLFGAAAARTPAAAAPIGKGDQALLIQMAQANRAEIDAAKLAQGKTQNQEVKNFAQKMIDDHTAALQEVQQLAQAKGVGLPAEADGKHKKMEQKMSALSGDAFDRRYMAQAGVADHQKTHALLRRVQTRAKDADVKALAAKLQPTVEEHLNSVRQVNAALGKGAGTASGSSGTAGSQGSGNTAPATKPKTGG
ncbi:MULTISPECIES: DUF4142 domain-containing protein [unclassified Janthinobacterium]|uniref:DUF4142 domain-containing protein n=1 Tax=unclassified Janthinobacterium TaxID=2610881 RepID=UPI00034B5806|nr:MULTISPECIES: DUF4142 domain-containing protein [unclassified Janthinobacterium]MEC5159186.1 putative membrane protein [Janthinobacterium sp. CG_S6]